MKKHINIKIFKQRFTKVLYKPVSCFLALALVFTVFGLFPVDIMKVSAVSTGNKTVYVKSDNTIHYDSFEGTNVTTTYDDYISVSGTTVTFNTLVLDVGTAEYALVLDASIDTVQINGACYIKSSSGYNSTILYTPKTSGGLYLTTADNGSLRLENIDVTGGVVRAIGSNGYGYGGAMEGNYYFLMGKDGNCNPTNLYMIEGIPKNDGTSHGSQIMFNYGNFIADFVTNNSRGVVATGIININEGSPYGQAIRQGRLNYTFSRAVSAGSGEYTNFHIGALQTHDNFSALNGGSAPGFVEIQDTVLTYDVKEQQVITEEVEKGAGAEEELPPPEVSGNKTINDTPTGYFYHNFEDYSSNYTENGVNFGSTDSTNRNWQPRSDNNNVALNVVNSNGNNVFEGNKSLQVTGRMKATDGVELRLDPGVFQPGERYNFDIRVRSANTSQQVQFQLTLQWYDPDTTWTQGGVTYTGGAVSYHFIQNTFVTNTYGRLQKVTASIPGDAEVSDNVRSKYLLLYIETKGDNGATDDFYVDAAYGGPAIKTPGTGSKYTNPVGFFEHDFEDDTAVDGVSVWQPHIENGISLNVVGNYGNNQGYNSEKALQLNGRDEDYEGTEIILKTTGDDGFKPGGTYRFGAWIKPNSDGYFKLSLQIFDSSTGSTEYKEIAHVDATAGNYAQLLNEDYTIPATAVVGNADSSENLVLYIETDKGYGSVQFFMDKAFGLPIEEEPDPVPVPVPGGTDVTLRYINAVNYVVTIPAVIEIDGPNTYEELTVRLQSRTGTSQRVAVSVSSDTTGDYWYRLLIDTADPNYNSATDAGKYVDYDVYDSKTPDATFADGYEFVQFATVGQEKTLYLNVTSADWGTVVANVNYKDTLTFSTYLVD
jgi:hypothetical protein